MQRYIGLALMTMSALFAGGKQRDWKTAKVVDEASYRQSYVTGSNTQTTATGSAVGGSGAVVGTAHIDSQTQLEREAMRTSQLVVLSEEFVYFVEDSSYRTAGSTGVRALGAAAGQAIRNRKHGCRFIIGDPIKYAQEKGTLYVIDADGKECHTAILRQERIIK